MSENNNSRTPHVQSTLAQLRRNDPNHATVILHIRYYSAQDIAEIVEAFNSGNDHVSALRLDFDGMERSLSSMTAILSMLESRTQLKTVVLLYSPLRMTTLVLGSISKNQSIESVVFYNRTVVSVEALSNLLKQTKSVSSLYLILGFIQEKDGFPMEELETAFRRNKSLEIVTLVGLDEEFVLVQILRGLAAHCKVRELNCGEYGVTSWTSLNAIRYCLEQSTTIEKVVFF